MDKVKKSIYYLYSFFLMSCFVLFSRNTLISSSLIGFRKTYFLLLIVSIPLVLKQLISIIKNKKISRLFLLLIISIIFSVLLKMDFKLYNLSILLYITIAYLYTNEFDNKVIIKNFIVVMALLMICSLAGVYIVKPNLLKIVSINRCLEHGLCYKNTSGTVFLNLFISFPVYISYYIRNFGIFTEPAFYQFYLFIVLIILLFSDSVKRIYIRLSLIFICIISILSTFSTAAYIVLPIVLFSCFVNLMLNKNVNKGKVLIVTLICISLFSFLSVKLISTNNNVKDMVGMIRIKLTESNDSSDTRIGGVISCVKDFIKSPLFGNKISYVINDNGSIANTNVPFFAIYGIIPGVLLLIIQYLFSYSFSDKKILRVLICICVLLSTNNHFFIGTMSFWVLMFVGINNEKNLFKKRSDKNESNVDC